MSTYSFAQDLPGQAVWGHRKHRRRQRARLQALAMREMRGGARPEGPWAEGPRGGHGGHGSHGGPFGRGGFGPGPRGRGRGRARRGDVRLALLRLLAEEPGNGYQLMQTIEERSAGQWRPSPGSVYPTLAQLEDEGLVRSIEVEGGRRSEITDAGREHLETRAGEPDPWDAPAEGRGSMREFKPLIAAVAAAAMQVAAVGDEGQRTRAIELLTNARRDLYRVLAEGQED